MNHREQILEMMEQGPVTRLQAAANGIIDLANRICELKSRGYNIKTEKFVKNGSTYARYHLITETESTET